MSTVFRKPIHHTSMSAIRRILVGKLFTFHPKQKAMVILGVRQNSYYGHLEVLIGSYDNYWHNVEVFSWYAYQPKNMMFISRSPKWMIRKCLKLNPEYIRYHLGKQVSIVHVQGDNRKYYQEYCNLLTNENVECTK